jgi:hypothetical protein
MRGWLIGIAGVLLCWLWFDFVTPRYGDAVRSHFVVNGKVLVAWFFGWLVIIGAVLALLRLNKKR